MLPRLNPSFATYSGLGPTMSVWGEETEGEPRPHFTPSWREIHELLWSRHFQEGSPDLQIHGCWRRPRGEGALCQGRGERTV